MCDLGHDDHHLKWLYDRIVGIAVVWRRRHTDWRRNAPLHGEPCHARTLLSQRACRWDPTLVLPLPACSQTAHGEEHWHARQGHRQRDAAPARRRDAAPARRLRREGICLDDRKQQKTGAPILDDRKKNCSCYEKGSYCSGDTRDSGLIPHKTSPHSLLSYDTTLRPSAARFPFDSPQAPNCFAARC